MKQYSYCECLLPPARSLRQPIGIRDETGWTVRTVQLRSSSTCSTSYLLRNVLRSSAHKFDMHAGVAPCCPLSSVQYLYLVPGTTLCRTDSTSTIYCTTGRVPNMRNVQSNCCLLLVTFGDVDVGMTLSTKLRAGYTLHCLYLQYAVRPSYSTCTGVFVPSD